MIGALRQAYDRFRGFGDHALSVPSLDGAYRPNSLLDAARVVAQQRDPDNLIAVRGALHFSSGAALLRIAPDGSVVPVRQFAPPITAMAASAEGEIAVALGGGGVLRLSPAGDETQLAPVQQGSDVTALTFLGDGRLAIGIGARDRTAAAWKHDVMSHGRSGSVWMVERGGQPRQVAAGLAWPCGLAEAGDGGLIVACAWDHALVRLDRQGPQAIWRRTCRAIPRGSRPRRAAATGWRCSRRATNWSNSCWARAPSAVMQEVSKSYHGAIAVDGVNFTLRKGEVHALIGENGAGKSTLTKMMCGVTEPTSGRIYLNGEEFVAHTPAEARARGVVMVFQETSLVPSMSVAQNLYLGDEKAFNKLRPLYISAQVFLSSLNFDVDPWAQAGNLGAAKKQMVEIARAVHQDARIIILTNPRPRSPPRKSSTSSRLCGACGTKACRSFSSVRPRLRPPARAPSTAPRPPASARGT